MLRNYQLNQQLMALILFISLFLQNCTGSFNNTSIGTLEEHNKQSGTQAIIDKEFVSKGGHLVTFYEEAGELKADVKMNAPQGFSKTYEGLDVCVEQGTELAILPKLSEQAQQHRIHIQLAQRESPARVIIYKDAGLMGGGYDEVILFLGNPGVGKSTLCNSIFQQKIFDSGISFGTGMTEEKQEHNYNNRLYIDTPGLDDAEKRLEAAKEIEEALKKNNNYKIVFVATLEEGRLRGVDLHTINTVCDALKDVDFQYGLIFNKIDNPTMEKIKKSGLSVEALRRFLKPLKKQPASIKHLLRDERIAGQDNLYFNSGDDNREILLKFLNDLPANMIQQNKVKSLDVRRFEEKIEEMEKNCQQAWREVAELRKTVESQRDRINELEDDRNKTC